MPDNAPIRALIPAGLARYELSRRGLLGGFAGLGAALVLAGCTPAPGGQNNTANGGLGDQLNLYSWADYDDPDNLAAFTAKKGPRIVVDVYDSNDAMVSKLRLGGATGGYDVIVPTGPTVERLIPSGLVQKLDKSLLPNLKNVDPAFTGLAWDPGNDYSVIKAWGATGYVYDRAAVGRELTDWADFLTAAAQPGVSGRVSVLTVPRDIAGIVFWRDGIDWNTDSVDDYAHAEDVLRHELLPHLRKVTDGASEVMQDGSVVLAQAWNGDAWRAVSADPDRFAWVLPSPTTEVWADNWMIPANAPHPEGAHAFIDFMLDPEVSAKEIAYFGYNTAVMGAQELLPPDLPVPEIIFITDEQKAMLSEARNGDGQIIAEEMITRLASEFNG